MKVIFNTDGSLFGVFEELEGQFNQEEFESEMEFIHDRNSYEEIINNLKSLGLKKINNVEEFNIKNK